MGRAPAPGSRRAAWMVFGWLFLSYAYFFQGGGWNPNSRLDLTRAIAERGSIAIDAYVANTDDWAHSGGQGGHYYTNKAPGFSFLAVPFYALGRLASSLLPETARTALAGPHLSLDLAAGGGRLEIFAVGLYAPAATALLVAFFFLFERRLAVATGTAVVCAALFGATSYVATHATFQFISLRNSSPAWTRARLTCTHSWSITRRPSASLVSCAHRRTSLYGCSSSPDEQIVTRSWLSWLVISVQPLFSPPTRLSADTRTSL